MKECRTSWLAGWSETLCTMANGIRSKQGTKAGDMTPEQRGRRFGSAINRSDATKRPAKSGPRKKSSAGPVKRRGLQG